MGLPSTPPAHCEHRTATPCIRQANKWDKDRALPSPNEAPYRLCPALIPACTRQQPGRYQLPRTAPHAKSLTNIRSEANQQSRAAYNTTCKTVCSTWYARLGDRVAFVASPLEEKELSQINCMSILIIRAAWRYSTPNEIKTSLMETEYHHDT